MSTAYHGELGDHFAVHAETSPYNAYTDRPAMLDLAGDVAGRRVLDLGCGAGHYAAALTARGASVTGVDGSAALLAHARRRAPEARFVQHDLERPLDFAADAAFDDVLSTLAYHHVAQRGRLLSECFRVLRPDGRLLLSTSHPAADWEHFGGSYFAEDWVDLPLGASTIHFQRMPLETTMSELLGAGFVLERLVEPRPVAALRAIDADAYAKLNRKPSFMAFALRRP